MIKNDIEQNIQVHDNIYEIYNSEHPEIYNNFEQNRIMVIISKIKKLILEKRPTVLDVGSGTGNLSLKFLSLGCEVTALDVSRKSLELLKKKSNNNQNLVLAIIKDKKLPFEDGQFDIVCVYSVLHHIPDYLFTVNEMIRVCRPGGFLYIDHEGNENKWNPDADLFKYSILNKKNRLKLLGELIKNRKLFTPNFIKTKIIKTFINKRYQSEGDIHVWNDDHIEWDKIKKLLEENNCKVIEEDDYLMYRTEGGMQLYRNYKNKCNDMKSMIIKKQ